MLITLPAESTATQVVLDGAHEMSPIEFPAFPPDLFLQVVEKRRIVLFNGIYQAGDQ